MSCVWQIVDTSASPYLVTQYPTQCPDDMNATYVASPGAILAMSITGQSQLSALAGIEGMELKVYNMPVSVFCNTGKTSAMFVY